MDADHDDCDGYAVTEPDGTIVDGGCHADRSDAVAMSQAINASKDAAESVAEGEKVEWGSSGDRTARGVVERVEADGTIDVPGADFTVEGTEDDPAALIRVMEPTPEGHVPTGDMAAHKVSTLSQTEFTVSETDDAAEGAAITLSSGEGLHIFRAGTHKGANGNTIDYSEEDVAAIATLYDPDIHEAPLVIGHPSDNEPAFGWVQDLSASGADLRAEPHQVEQNFAEAVRSGRFKKISASFYPPSHPNHPVPSASAPYLRHVGFLGAKAPAVKGLDTPDLADDEDLVTVTHDLAKPDMPDDPESLLRRMMDTLQGYFNSEDASEPGDAADSTDLADIPVSEVESMIEESDMSREEAVEAIAEEAGVEPGTVNAVMREEHGASLETIEAINSVLGAGLSTEDAQPRNNAESTETDMPDDEQPDDATEEEPTDDASEDEDAEGDPPSAHDRLDELEEQLEATRQELSEKEEALQQERKQRKAAERKAERVDDLTEAEQQVRRREIEDTVQDAAENGRIHANHAPLWADLLELAEEAEESLDNAVIDFSEAGVGTDEAQTLRDTLEYIMNNQGPVVALGEMDEFEEEAEPVNLSDVDSIQRAAKQEQKRAEENGESISFSEAVDRIKSRTEAA